MPAHRGRRVWSRLPDGRFLVEGNPTLPAQVGPALEQVVLATWMPRSSTLDTILELPGAPREVVRERGRLVIRDPHFAGQCLIGVRRSELHYSDGRSFCGLEGLRAHRDVEFTYITRQPGGAERVSLE